MRYIIYNKIYTSNGGMTLNMQVYIYTRRGTGRPITSGKGNINQGQGYAEVKGAHSTKAQLKRKAW